MIRKPNTKDYRVLFLYPNERGMSTIPPSIVTLSQILKSEGHQTGKTFYLGGTFGEIKLDEKDMKLFLEENEKTFRQISLEYMEKFK